LEVPVEEVAAIIMEPVQREGGAIWWKSSCTVKKLQESRPYHFFVVRFFHL